ncbi:IQ motif and SEC7 domain-containing protein 1-like isoform X2 [Dendronephthya gigantea]|uniref:IQ motif and SEC7 domain-containing protein 1-like isoform X2 n=1 Tax=Dendronephthya gigantea TaxID=151771 RepID=UPI00106CF545|nr:IQ motif and SEC7 domain-containing protein 1-like isoform X2 [Dendronephthya gigantea]
MVKPTMGLYGQDKLGGSCDSFDMEDSHSHSWPALDHLLHEDDTISLSGNSLSPSSSIMQTFYEDKERDVRIGINHFNRKPKKGINYLMDTQIIDEDDAEGVCKFLREEPGINKQKIGEYLGNLRNPLSMEVLQLFVRTIPMIGKEVDEALRHFQTFFRMPGEAQKIERIVEEFANVYVEANPGKISDTPDTILVLAFAIIMLNTDLHSPNVKRKMSKEQFIRNLRGTNDGEDIPSELLSAIFDRVEKKQFRTGPDNLDAIYKYEKQILGKVPWTTLALPHRQLRQVTTLYEIQHGGKKKEKPHHRVVFLFNDMMVVTKERGQAGQKGIHYYSYKNSYPLCDIKYQLFNNNYYKYGMRILNKISGEVLVVFHAKKEDIRKAFYTELRDCIEETCVMENERITDCEKTRQLMGFRRDADADTISLTLPRPGSNNKKKAPDSVSLVNEPGGLISHVALRRNNPLSSSLQDLNQAGGTFYGEIQKSTSMASFELTGSGSTSGISSDFSSSNGSMQNLTKRFGIFSSKRVKNAAQNSRKLTKSAGSLEEIQSMRRKTSTSSDKRKSEFFVTSPIAT